MYASFTVTLQEQYLTRRVPRRQHASIIYTDTGRNEN
jgi:hypothetical protein